MQRGAVELHAALAAHPALDVAAFAIHPSWRTMGRRTTVFIGHLAAALPARARHHRADVVLFTSLVTASVAPGVRARMGGVRLATVANGQDVTLPVAVYQRWLRGVFARLDGVLPVSRATGEACLQRGATPERLHVVPTGVDVERFADGPDRMEARAWLEQRHGLPPEAFVLVTLGRQVRRKGTAWFTREVMPLLPPQAHFVVAGDGPETPAIRAAGAAAGMGERVHLLGRVPEQELQRVLRSGDLFVMPNVPVAGDMEGLGLVAYEANLSGLPVLAADMEGMRDTITEGANGHLLPPLDAAAFAARIAHYAAEPAALDRLAEQSRRHAEQTFGWPAIADRYVAALERVVAAPPVG